MGEDRPKLRSLGEVPEPNFAKQGQRVIGWIIVVFLAIIGLLYAIGVLPR